MEGGEQVAAGLVSNIVSALLVQTASGGTEADEADPLSVIDSVVDSIATGECQSSHPQSRSPWL